MDGPDTNSHAAAPVHLFATIDTVYSAALQAHMFLTGTVSGNFRAANEPKFYQ